MQPSTHPTLAYYGVYPAIYTQMQEQTMTRNTLDMGMCGTVNSQGTSIRIRVKNLNDNGSDSDENVN